MRNCIKVCFYLIDLKDWNQEKKKITPEVIHLKAKKELKAKQKV